MAMAAIHSDLLRRAAPTAARDQYTSESKISKWNRRSRKAAMAPALWPMSDAEQHAQRDAEPGDDAALDEEDRHDPPRRRAERAQDGDVGALVGDHHGQHGHQVERRHRHDQHQDDGHHGLLDADGAEIAGVIQRPVADLDAGRQQLRRVPRRNCGAPSASVKFTCSDMCASGSGSSARTSSSAAINSALS